MTQQKIRCTVKLNKTRLHDGYADPWAVQINVDGVDSISVYFKHQYAAENFQSNILTAYRNALSVDAELTKHFGTFGDK